MIKLYGFGPTRSIRPLWTLRELGVPFDFVEVNMFKGEHMKPPFLAINPAGKVPALVDGDLVLNESVAIVVYLADKYPEKKLLPVDLHARAKALSWMLFTATELEQPLWRISKNMNLYPEDKRQPSDVAMARADFAPMAAILEKHMTGREFIVGDHVTVADFVAAYTLDWANEAKLLEELPTLRSYMEKMYERPHAPPRIVKAFAAVRAANAPNANASPPAKA